MDQNPSWEANKKTKIPQKVIINMEVACSSETSKNVLPYYTALYKWRQLSSYSSSWEPQAALKLKHLEKS
jgi:hypothetical protein